jgi:hypothetical protein
METKIGSEIKTIQEKVDAIQEKVINGQEDMKGQVGSLVSWISVSQEEMKALLDACLEKLEENPGELQCIVVHQVGPKEEAAVEIIVALNDWLGDRHLAVGCCQQTKTRPRTMVGSSRSCLLLEDA